jgi:hypothetical protein
LYRSKKGEREDGRKEEREKGKKGERLLCEKSII